MITGAVDRIEGDWIIVVLDSGKYIQVPVSVFPDFQPGDVVDISIQKDSKGQQEAKERIDKIRSGLKRVDL